MAAGSTAESDELVGALGWLSERLAEAAPLAEPHRSEALPWESDAAAHPTDYWHWLHLRRQAEVEHPPERHLPVEGPLLSVVVPVYRPELWFFRKCVESVIRQTYRTWELCLCDDGSDDAGLTALMEELAATDPRIKMAALPQNGGISRASNGALALATGEVVVLVDHDDLLEPEALAEVAAAFLSGDDVDLVYTDEDKYDQLDRPCEPHFKPDWSPDLLLAYPYLGHLTAIRRDLLLRVGGFRPELDGSQDFDVMLRVTEQARRVVHVPRVLYHWRVVVGSAAGDSEAKPWAGAPAANRRTLEEAITRRGIDGFVDGGPFLGAYHLRRRVQGTPTVSVIIPFRDQAPLTAACLDSLERAPGLPIAETVLIDNGSTEPETRALRRRLERRPRTRVLDEPGAFNWAAINNAAAATCPSDLLLFLNNDIEAVSDGWLAALVEQGQRSDVGAVGARLSYPDGTLQHAGVVVGLGSPAGHILAGLPRGSRGYLGWDLVVREYSAVTGACMLVRREVFEQLGGFDEAYAVAFNDIDFCLRLGQAGYRVLYTPHAQLTHHESVSRGFSGFSQDVQRFLVRWGDMARSGDPYYNPNLGLSPWCPLRGLEEDERWHSELDRLLPGG